MPYDVEYSFEETTEQHATRLGQTQRWAKIRRRALLLKLDGLTPRQVHEQMGRTNCPEDLADAGVEGLLAALAVTLAEEQALLRNCSEITLPNQRAFLPQKPMQSDKVISPRVLIADPEAPLPRLSGFERTRQVFGQHGGHLSDKEGLARAGVMLGQPYGYGRHGRQEAVVCGMPRFVPRIVVIPDEADTIHFLFQECIKDGSFPDIAADLNRRQVPTRSGRPWSADTLRDMLRNPVYAGYVLYRGAQDRNRRDAGTLYPGQHEPIVSWETFCQAQDARVRRDPRDPKPFWTCSWGNAPRRNGEGQ
jgi:hypothetical protein